MREDNIDFDRITDAVERTIERHTFLWKMYNLKLDRWFNVEHLGDGIYLIPMRGLGIVSFQEFMDV